WRMLTWQWAWSPPRWWRRGSASPSSPTAAAGGGPAVAGAVCAAAAASPHSSPATAAHVKRIMRFLPGCAVASPRGGEGVHTAGYHSLSIASLSGIELRDVEGPLAPERAMPMNNLLYRQLAELRSIGRRGEQATIISIHSL